MVAIFPDDIFKAIFVNDNVWISIKIPWKNIPMGSKSSTLVRKMAWRRSGDKPLPEPMMAYSTEAYASLYRMS